MRNFVSTIALALFAPLVSAQVPALPDLGDVAQADLTPQMERKVGEEVMRDIRRDPDFVSDPEVTSFVQSIGQRLVAVSPDVGRPFEFFVLRDPTINAFAMPGGFVGVHTGLIVNAQTESELASVLAHEIGHVVQHHMARQLEKQNQLSVLSMLGLAVGLLAARSNPQAAQAAIIGAQAVPVSAYLSYSRDYEREADRVGFQILKASGYDVFGMPSFFERLQQNSRLYDNNAPAYLRTHPLTSERLADMENRVQQLPVRPKPDSPEFQLVRAKLRAQQGESDEAVAYFRGLVREKRFADEQAARYGYAVALARAKDFKAAAEELAPLRKQGAVGNPMIENLAAQLRSSVGDFAGARTILDAALHAYPDNLALGYSQAEVLESLGLHRDAIAAIDKLISAQPRDATLYKMRAKSFAMLGNRVEQHRSLAEAYYLEGSIPAAIEQLQFAQSSGQGDFYTLSTVDARIRALRREQADEVAQNRKGRGP